jgi:hypothetical protein
LADVDDIYVRTLRNTHTGYAMVTTLQILTHLYTTYGKLTPMAMQENDRHFCNPYNPAEPFEMMVQQIEEAQDFAAAGNQAYTAQQIVSNAYSLIHNTGMFIDACCEWRRHPDNEKTWTNFKTHFAQAHTELGELTHTSQAGGTTTPTMPSPTLQPTLAKPLAIWPRPRRPTVTCSAASKPPTRR